MEHLLSRKLTGNRHTKVKEHRQRTKRIAATIYRKFQVGPYQYQLKHLRWYLDTQTRHLQPATRYRYWLTVRNITAALSKDDQWVVHLQGCWRSASAHNGLPQ